MQVTADLTPLNTRKVAVKFDYFKIGGLVSLVPSLCSHSIMHLRKESFVHLYSLILLYAIVENEPNNLSPKKYGEHHFSLIWQIPVKAPERARGELEITYLDEELRLVTPYSSIHGLSEICITTFFRTKNLANFFQFLEQEPPLEFQTICH